MYIVTFTDPRQNNFTRPPFFLAGDTTGFWWQIISRKGEKIVNPCMLFICRCNVNVMKSKCKLILSNGTITKESCNWIEFISVAQCQMTSLKVWLHTALGCNHQSFVCPSYSLMFGCSGTQIDDPWSAWFRNRREGRMLEVGRRAFFIVIVEWIAHHDILVRRQSMSLVMIVFW